MYEYNNKNKYFTLKVKIMPYIFMSKQKYDNQVSRNSRSLPVGIVILYFLFIVERGTHSEQLNPFLLKYEAIDEGHISASKKHYNTN